MTVSGDRRLLLRPVHSIEVSIQFTISDQLDDFVANWMQLQQWTQIIDVIRKNSQMLILLPKLA